MSEWLVNSEFQAMLLLVIGGAALFSFLEWLASRWDD